MQSSQGEYKKYLQLVVRRKELFIILALLFMTAVFVTSYVLPKKYESSSTVFIEKNVISELVKGLTVTPSMEDTINGLTYSITSRSLLNKVIDSLDMSLSKNETEREALLKRLQQNTHVKMKEKSNQFTISFSDENPRVARDFVNTLVRLYIEENMSSKRGESYDATKFLSEQIGNFNTKLEKAEQEVNAYKRDKGGVISIDESKLFEQINISQQKLYDLELQRRQLEGMRQVTRKNNDPMQNKLLQLQKRLDELRVQYTETYPEIVSVRSDIETVKEQLKERKGAEYQSLDPQELAKIESQIAALKVSEDGLRRNIATNRNLLQNIPTAKAGLEKLELEKKKQKNIYDQLYARQGQSEVSKQMEVQDKSTTFRVVDPAVLPITPASPDRLKLMAMGIVGGFAAAFGVLVLLDQLDATVKGVDGIKGFGVPVLAVVPRMFDPQLQLADRKRSRRLFGIAGVYFLFLLCFPVMELLQLTYMDRIIAAASPANLVQGVKGSLH